MIKIKSIPVGLIVLTLLTNSCKNDNTTQRNTVFSTDNLLAQKFSVSADTDTILVGKSGTKIRIYKNTFVDDEGKIVKGIIDIELREALKSADIVLGNLFTLSNGKLLQTGGMVFINATQDGDNLEIINKGALGLVVPTDSVRANMQIFKGVADSSVINWHDPEPALNGLQWAILDKDTIRISEINNKFKADTISSEFENNSQAQFEHDHEIERNSESGGELINKINQDSLFFQEIQQPKGTNLFITDYNMTYVFTMKKLGWANIDRLYSDPRTKEVEFITEIENKADFKTIYITMVTESMFLPGYQMKNETFCFTHNDEEKPHLPVGASAFIIATSYKNDVPFFAMKKITILDEQTITLKLVQTTFEQLKTDMAMAL